MEVAEKNNNITDAELAKSLRTIFSDDELKEILEKGEKPVENSEENEDMSEEEVEEMKKSLEKAKSDYASKAEEIKKMEDKLDKAGCVKKSEDEDLNKGDNKPEEQKPAEKIEKSEDDRTRKPEDNPEQKSEDLNKSETVDLVKGAFDKLNNKIEENSEATSEILKSLQAINENQSKIAEELDRIGSQPQGRKGIKNLNFIEKSEGGLEDNDGKTVLHVTKDKYRIEKAIEDLIDETDNDIKKSELSDQLIGYNAGGAMLSKSLVTDLFNKKNIRLVAAK